MNSLDYVHIKSGTSSKGVTHYFCGAEHTDNSYFPFDINDAFWCIYRPTIDEDREVCPSCRSKVASIFRGITMSDLNSEQAEILKHTMKNGLFCGESADMDILCGLGLMTYAGEKPFVPDKYYSITPKGRVALDTTKEDNQ